MTKDKQELIESINKIEERYNVKLINDKGEFNDFAIKLLLTTGIYYALKGFELIYNLNHKEILP